MSKSDPTSEQVKDVYAHFGSAYYFSEVLHRGLCNYYALASMPAHGGTRFRMEELLSRAYSCTLGQVATMVEPLLPKGTAERVRGIIALRNFLAHRFWWNQIHLLMTAEGTRQAVEELSAAGERFVGVDREIDALTRELFRKIGVTPEMLTESLEELARGGEGVEPFHEQRTLRKRETIIAVHEAPTIGAGNNLVFETEDGALWQLSEVGLGWSPYQRVEEVWSRCKVFEPFMPATIDPRPRGATNWNYELHLGERGVLKVSFDQTQNVFRWNVEPRGAEA